MDKYNLNKYDKCALLSILGTALAVGIRIAMSIIPGFYSNTGPSLTTQLVVYIVAIASIILGVIGVKSKKYRIYAYISLATYAVFLVAITIMTH